MSKNIIIFVVAALVAVLAISVVAAQAQAQTQQRKQMAGFNNITINTALENQNRLVNIAVLHNATYDKR